MQRLFVMYIRDGQCQCAYVGIDQPGRREHIQANGVNIQDEDGTMVNAITPSELFRFWAEDADGDVMTCIAERHRFIHNVNEVLKLGEELNELQLYCSRNC